MNGTGNAAANVPCSYFKGAYIMGAFLKFIATGCYTLADSVTDPGKLVSESYCGVPGQLSRNKCKKLFIILLYFLN